MIKLLEYINSDLSFTNFIKDLDKKEEELRLFKEKHLKQELLEELKDDLIRKNIPAENVEEMINKEYTKNKVFPPL